MGPRTYQQILTMIRRRLGWPPTDTFVSNAEIVDMIRESKKELFDFMVSIHQGMYRLSRTSLTTVAGQDLYVIQRDPAGTLGDIVGVPMERVVRVAALIDGQSIPLRQLQIETELRSTIPVTWDASTDMRYRFAKGLMFGEMLDWSLWLSPIPANAIPLEIFFNLGSGTDSVSATGAFNDLENDEYIVLDGMIKCLQMEETDAGPAMAQKERLIQRLTNEATPLDVGQPQPIPDVRGRDRDAEVFWRRG